MPLCGVDNCMRTPSYDACHYVNLDICACMQPQLTDNACTRMHRTCRLQLCMHGV